MGDKKDKDRRKVGEMEEWRERERESFLHVHP